MPTTYHLTVAYDGTNFCGWQRQTDGRTVQGTLAQALRRVLPEQEVWPQGASRTDAGVHALGQSVSITSSRSLPPSGLMKGANSLLPPDVAVVNCREAPAGFNARHHSIYKIYQYRIWNRPHRFPLEHRTTWHIRKPLDLDKMELAAGHLLGEHDFSAFRASDCSAVRTVRRMHAISFEPSAQGVVTVVVKGDAFMKHMVRNMVGTLVEVGRLYRPPDQVAAILASGDRRRAGVTAPAAGLYLCEVGYP